MDTQDLKEVKDRIEVLIDKYKSLSLEEIRKYTEEETKKDFILPLFDALGWNVLSKEEVTAEESQSSGRVDYGFYFNGRIKFYVEAKKLSSDLHNEKYAKQAIRYSWNKGVDWAILTDFESIKIFYCQDPTQSLFSKLVFEIKFDEYIDRFDKLRFLSKEAFNANELDTYAKDHGKKMQKISVGDQLYKHLNECRKLLLDRLGFWNGVTDRSLLEEGVQQLLDRLIFIRVAEDRGIEPPTLIPLLRYWESDKSGRGIYETMIDKFRELDDIYNSNLFSPHPFEKWQETPGVTEKVINMLQGKSGYYEYDFKVIPADILGAVYENYLGHRLSESTKGIVLDKNAKKRKEQGIYYTPEFIVDYIVKNALKPLLDKCQSINDLKKLKVLDPTCGSGSFLIKALELINQKYKDFGNKGDEFTKIQILQENIYGVDLDEQAVEIARLNLLLHSLENRMKLPKLDKNIKNGNSLISGSENELKKYFGENYRDKRPFNWEEEFPEVFKQGGFDVIIGNPPYIRVQALDKKEIKYFNGKYNVSTGNYDIYILFIEKSVTLLKTEGYFGMILPNKFMSSEYGQRIRQMLSSKKIIRRIVDFGDYQIFHQAMTYTCLLFLQNAELDRLEYIDLSDNIKGKVFNHIDDRNLNINFIPFESLSNKSWVLTSNSVAPLINKIINGFSTLRNITKKIFQGLITGADNVFILEKNDSEYFSEATSKRYLLEDELLHPLLKGSLNIRRYTFDHTNKFILFPYKTEGDRVILLTQSELREYYPLCWKYLNENKIKLENRENGKWKGDKWYSFSRTQNMNLMSISKILTPSIAKNNSFTIDEKGEYYFVGSGGGGGGGYGILIKDREISQYYLLGILNSKVLEFLIKKFSSKFSGDYYAYSASYIGNLPIPISKNQSVIANLVKKLLFFNKKVRTLPVGSNDWNSLRQEIERIDQKVDEEVYKLYKLTPEEIAIVEGKSENNSNRNST